ncbi:hypothetical protein M1D72_10525 [Vibrio sp. AK197]
MPIDLPTGSNRNKVEALAQQIKQQATVIEQQTSVINQAMPTEFDFQMNTTQTMMEGFVFELDALPAIRNPKDETPLFRHDTARSKYVLDFAPRYRALKAEKGITNNSVYYHCIANILVDRFYVSGVSLVNMVNLSSKINLSIRPIGSMFENYASWDVTTPARPYNRYGAQINGNDDLWVDSTTLSFGRTPIFAPSQITSDAQWETALKITGNGIDMSEMYQNSVNPQDGAEVIAVGTFQLVDEWLVDMTGNRV